jgi:hypothetical protein
MLTQDAAIAEDKILHLRNFPVDLHSQLKSQAALDGIPMRDFIIEALWKAILPDKKSERRTA